MADGSPAPAASPTPWLAALAQGVHPEGPAAHVERHLSLLEGGWRVLDAYPSRWSDRQGELVVELLREL